MGGIEAAARSGSCEGLGYLAVPTTTDTHSAVVAGFWKSRLNICKQIGEFSRTYVTSLREMSRTHHDTTSNYATPHDNAKHRVPRHNTHPNAAQNHNTTKLKTTQHGATQHPNERTTTTQRGGATPYHTTNQNTTALHGVTMERTPHTYYTTPRNAETRLKITSPPTRHTTPKHTTKQRYAITRHNMLHNATNRQATTRNTA